MGPAPAISTRAPASTPGLADGGDADRQRFTQRGGVVGDRVGNRVRELRADGHVVAERAVDGRGAEEPHVRAQVIVAAPGLRAVRIGPLRFDRHALTDARGVDRIHRRRRSSPPPRGRAPAGLRRRSCRPGRRGSSGCPTRRRRPTTPVSAHHPARASARDAAPSRFDPVRRDGGPHLGIWRKCCVRHTRHASVMSIYSHP